MARAAHQSVLRYPLTTILGTDAAVRLLRELAGHGGQLSAPDLVRRTALAKASVARGLEALVAANVVATAGSGRSLLYRIAQDHPLSPALRSLFEAEDRLFHSILDSIKSAAQSAGQGVVAVWLYGSVARREDRTDSDLDLALVAKAKALPRLADSFRDALVAPGERLGFNASVVTLGTSDVVRLAAERDPWWENVARDALALIGARPEDLAAMLRRALAV